MDKTSLGILIIIIFCVLPVAGLIAYKVIGSIRKKNTGDIIQIKQKSDSKDHLYLIYRVFGRSKFLKKFFHKVRATVEILYPADELSINKEISRILTRTVTGGIMAFIATIAISGGDIYFILAGCALTYILITSLTTNRINKLRMVVLQQFGDFLTKLRHYYHDTGNIESSLYATLDVIPYEINLHIQKIYDIIRSADMNYEVDQYVGTEPNKYMLMFVSLCASVKEYGDRKIDDGTSLFLNDINYLKEEVNNEIIGERKNAAAFKSLTILALAPLIAIKPLEIWAASTFPELRSYYTGTYGIVAMIVIFLVSIATHALITSLRDGADRGEVEESIWKNIAGRREIQPMLARIINRYYTTYLRYDDMLHGMGDHTGPAALLVKQITYAAAAFALSLFLMIGASFTSRYQAIHSFSEAFTESVVPNEEYRNTMRRMAETEAVELRKYRDTDLNKDDISEAIQNKSKLKKSYADEVAEYVIERVAKYHKTYFKWFEIIIAVLIAFAAFNIPIYYLKWNKRIIDSRKEEEVIRFQSIMLILMHIKGTTLPVILEWMERFSYCFRESITTCRVNLASGTNKALADLKASEQYGPFEDFVDNLISIDKVGVEKAFDEIQTDREYYMKKREQDRDENIMEKSSLAKMISNIPLYVTIGLYLIVPIIIYAVNMFTSVSTILNQRSI